MEEPDVARPVLEARGLVLRRGGRLVLDGASLSVAAGHVTALVAPSGAGKSTLLRCCTGLLVPDAGEVVVAGRPLASWDARELRRRVGLVQQHPRMLPGTVADNVGWGVASPDVEGALQAAGLSPSFAPRDAAQLSGGEQARVAIARALSRDPAVLLLDEPTAALDAEAAAHLGQTLRGLAARGIGVCVATHDLAWCATVADRRASLPGPTEPRDPVISGLGDRR
ncbi:ABC transporter ATP-binding protein [Conexibacter sp. SYSU D00693]|uniref:ABC transporter ATP-binding protein n=1 Tax=Conexibacter sp. SYSU D00693 TaxID=2812560 RepID=UPI00196AEBF0|nr:ABC transporter ATP-binding protein [Conexibacter sp. SYSU D00693]